MDTQQKTIQLLEKQWEEARKYLYENTFQTMESLCNNLIFFERFLHMYEYSGEHIEISVQDIKRDHKLFRIVNESNHQKVNSERFIPKYPSLNRMNGPDRLYYYFTTDYQLKHHKDAIKMGLLEIRAKADDKIYKARFGLKDEIKNKKVVCLCTRKETLRNEYGIFDAFKKAYIKNSGDRKKTQDDIGGLALEHVFYLWEKAKIFAPIDKQKMKTEEQERYYRPFHVISDYFERMGYAGILFRSTVYPEGFVLTIFNLEDAYLQSWDPKAITWDYYMK